MYFDVASPFSYLGLTQVPALAAMGASPRLVPILVGALFRAIGQVDVPIAAMPPAKQRYVAPRCRAGRRGGASRSIPPRKFPQRTVTAQRLCVLAAAEGFEIGMRVATALARGMWAEQRDLEDPATLQRSSTRSIYRPARPRAGLAQTQAPEIKARLAANTAEGAGRGGVRCADVRRRSPAAVLGQDSARAGRARADRLDLRSAVARGRAARAT